MARKQAYIDSQRDRLSNTTIRMQNQLFSDILAEIIPELDIKDGIIQDNAKNYRLISMLDKTYKSFNITSSQVMFSQIAGTTMRLVDMNTKYYKSVFSDTLPARFDKVIIEANKLINLKIGIDGDKIFKGGYLDSYFNSSNIGTELKQITSQAVTSNMNLKDYVKVLKNKITGTEEYTGALERQFNMYAYDLYQQYDAAYNLTIGNEFGFDYFIYQGGLIGDSRDFCAAHNNKVWSREEAQSWGEWTPSLGEYPAGWEIKAKDMYSVPSYLSMPGYDPLINRGGYHCRHSLGWIPEDVALQRRPELKEVGSE